MLPIGRQLPSSFVLYGGLYLELGYRCEDWNRNHIKLPKIKEGYGKWDVGTNDNGVVIVDKFYSITYGICSMQIDS